jgi:hypothetical protein
MSELKVGDNVLYSPCQATYWHDTDAAGDHVFEFVHASGPKEGQPAAKFGIGPGAADMPMGAAEMVDHLGVIHTSKGHRLKLSRPRRFWAAEVVEDVTLTAVDHPEGILHKRVTRLALQVCHPNGFLTYTLPLDGAGAVRHDPAKGSHTWHREGE